MCWRVRGWRVEERMDSAVRVLPLRAIVRGYHEAIVGSMMMLSCIVRP
jgi:hypothetical protein